MVQGKRDDAPRVAVPGDSASKTQVLTAHLCAPSRAHGAVSVSRHNCTRRRCSALCRRESVHGKCGGRGACLLRVLMPVPQHLSSGTCVACDAGRVKRCLLSHVADGLDP